MIGSHEKGKGVRWLLLAGLLALVLGWSPSLVGAVVARDSTPIVRERIRHANRAAAVGQSLGQDSPRVTVSLTPAEQTAEPGETLQVTVSLSTVVPLRTLQCSLRFDPAVFEAIGFEAGPFFVDWANAHGGTALVFPNPPPIDNVGGKAGVVSIAIMGGEAGGPTGSGAFGSFRLRVRPEAAAQESHLRLEDVVAGDDQADPVPERDIAVSGGVVIIGGESPGATPTPTAQPPRPGTPQLTVSLAPTEQSARPGESLDVTVDLSSKVALRTLQCALRFDPAVLEAVGFEPGPFFVEWANAHGGTALVFPNPPPIDNVQGKAGVVSIAIMGGEAGGPSGTGVFGTFRLKVRPGAAAQVTELRLEDVVAGDDQAEPVPETEIVISGGRVNVTGAAASPTATVPPSPTARPTTTPSALKRIYLPFANRG